MVLIPQGILRNLGQRRNGLEFWQHVYPRKEKVGQGTSQLSEVMRRGGSAEMVCAHAEGQWWVSGGAGLLLAGEGGFGVL